MDFLLILLLIALNASFAMSEMALVASRKALLSERAKAGNKGAQAAMGLIAQPTHFLSSVQVGITSIGVLNGIVGEAAFSGALAQWLQVGQTLVKFSAAWANGLATVLVVAAITFVTIVFGELVPKRIGQLFPEAVACAMARPMHLLARVAYPFVWLLTRSTGWVLRVLRINGDQVRVVTHEEISANLEEGLDAGVIDAHEHSLVQNVFELEDRTLASLMLPRREITWLDQSQDLKDALSQAALAGHSWYPVCDGDWSRVTGIVSLSQLLLLQQSEQAQVEGSCWSDLVEPVIFVPETLSAKLLLHQFKQRAERMALVVDEYGEVQGLITPQDLLQAITGELHMPAQGVASSHQQSDGSWVLDGQLGIAELRNKLTLESDLPHESDDRYNTLGGLLMSELGQLPVVGSRVRVGSWQLQVTQMEGHRVAKVLARREETPAE